MRSLSVHAFLLAALSLGLLTAPASAQEPKKKGHADDFSLDLPTNEVLFRVQSEAGVRMELREQAEKKGVKKVEFPPDHEMQLKVVPFASADDPHSLTLPPSQICYLTLYYQDIPAQRYLKSWCVLEPFREAFLFYGKTFILPGLLVAFPPCQFHCWDYPYRP